MGKLRVLSYSELLFEDRRQAGRLLAEALGEFRGRGTVVLGIPRGGMVVAAETARMLNAESDIVLSRKLGAPGNPELAIGAVAEDGKIFLNEGLAFHEGADDAYIEEEKRHQTAEIATRIKIFRAVKAKVPCLGKTVVVTDDGVATGSTMLAALWAARRENPKQLVCAIPVGAAESVRLLADHADLTIVLRMPPELFAISQFYAHFGQTSDTEVLDILRQSKRGPEDLDEK